MHTLLIVINVVMLMVVPVLAHALPIAGQVLGKVAGFEWVRGDHGDLTKYTVVVLSDSSYQGQSLESGSTMELWTPGARSGLGVWDLVDGSVQTVTMIVGEKVFCTYRVLFDRLFILDKWTVWKVGAPHDSRTDSTRTTFLSADVALEEYLGRDDQRSEWLDSLEVFHTNLDPGVLFRLQPPAGQSWRDYGLVSGRSSISLRALKEKLRRY